MVTLEQSRFSLFALAAVIALAGCSMPLAPESRNDAGVRVAPSAQPGIATTDPSGQLFFPLEIGNHWKYLRHSRVQEFLDGRPPSPPVFATFGYVDIRITESAVISGREYLIWEERRPEANGAFVYHRPSRQDRSGFFQLDGDTYFDPGPSGASATPEFVYRGPDSDDAVERARTLLALARNAASGITAATAAADPSEYTILVYPLHPGSKWSRESNPAPIVTYHVEAHDVIDLPAGRFPAWRLRVELPGFPDLLGPNDRLYLWTSRNGLLRTLSHVENGILDETAFPPVVVGVRKVDAFEDLVEHQLVSPETSTD